MLALKRLRIIAVAILSLSLFVVGCGDDDEDNNGVIVDAGDDAGQDVAEDAPTDVPADAPEDAPADAPEDAPADAPDDVQEDGDVTVSAVVEVDCTTVTADEVVSMQNIAFNPATFTISAGDVVQWDNDETTAIPHTVTSGRPGDTDAGDLFDSGNISAGESFCLQFNETGAFEYYCEIHPTQMDDGVATVE